MLYILIDNDPEALGYLMNAVAETALATDLIKAICPSTKSLEYTYLASYYEKLKTAGRSVDVHQVNTQQELADMLLNFASTTGPAVLCSDLTMKIDDASIDLEVNKAGWKNPNNVVRSAVHKFAGLENHLVCLHSSSGSVPEVVELMGGPAARIYGLTGNIDTARAGKTTIEQAKIVAQEIARKIAQADNTPLEKLWANGTAKNWFSSPDSALKHNWSEVSDMPSYKSEVAEVFKACMPKDFPRIPEVWWTECFHESLKGVTGGTFCGTVSKAGEPNGTKPLRLGGVILIAVMAYVYTRNTYGKFIDVWAKLPTKAAELPFLNDNTDTKQVAVGLWWFFVRAFENEKNEKNGGNVTDINSFADGLGIVFSWNPTSLFQQSRLSVKKTKVPALVSLPLSYPRPATTTDALADVLRLLAVERGRILDGWFEVRIQAVSDKIITL